MIQMSFNQETIYKQNTIPNPTAITQYYVSNMHKNICIR